MHMRASAIDPSAPHVNDKSIVHLLSMPRTRALTHPPNRCRMLLVALLSPGSFHDKSSSSYCTERLLASSLSRSACGILPGVVWVSHKLEKNTLTDH